MTELAAETHLAVNAAAPHPVRERFLPYCVPSIGEEEISEVVDSLRAGWLTTGPKVKRFENDLAAYVGVRNAIAVSSCTAALHLSLAALGIGPGDEVIVPTLTFCSTANVVEHLGATPVLVDIERDFQISLQASERALTSRTRAIIPVHYAGQACDMEPILDWARARKVAVVEDAAHAIGAEYAGRKIGCHGRAVCFSFYATKNLSTGEGGMITTGDDQLAEGLRRLALHGMSRDAWKRYGENGSWYYEVLEPGYKDNMTDIQAALGIHQLRRLDGFIRRRQEIAARYDAAFAGLPELERPPRLPNRNHVFHLYPIRLCLERLRLSRGQFIERLREYGIGASVHFIPLHRHRFYQMKYRCRPNDFRVAEEITPGLVSLPLYPGMGDRDVEDVILAVGDIVQANC